MRCTMWPRPNRRCPSRPRSPILQGPDGLSSIGTMRSPSPGHRAAQHKAVVAVDHHAYPFTVKKTIGLPSARPAPARAAAFP
jgi:hypothetical protein